MLRAVIMAGGSGTRFWPLSRSRLPKQFLNLHGERSLLQQAYDRIEGLVGADGMMVVTNHQHAAMTREQLPNLPDERLVREPCGRDTAACIGLAAALLVKDDPDGRMIVLAADHLIEPTASFQDAVRLADRFVQHHPEALITFGIAPTHPATGYGYLRRQAETSTNGVFKLHSFHEKPNAETAREYLDRGDFYWNSGIFCWRCDTILKEIERCSPALHHAACNIADAWSGPNRDTVFANEFEPLPKISIDFAVMEKATDAYMIETPFEWDDVGGWLALERVMDHDDDGNAALGLHTGMRTKNCVIAATKDHLVASIGVEDLIVVHTADVTLVAHRNDEQNVKKMLAQMTEQGLDAYL